MTELAIKRTPAKRKRSTKPSGGQTRSAANGTVVPAIVAPPSAVTSTSAPSVVQVTRARNVRRRIETSAEYMRPRFARDLVWENVEDDVSPAAQYSLTTEPLPRLPQSELLNAVANKTILTHPHLFKITCNINIKKFSELLQDHPNQPFVHSVIVGFTEGFWPWAEHQDGYPVTHCEPQHPPKDDWVWYFLLEQCEKEIKAGRFSELFTNL